MCDVDVAVDVAGKVAAPADHALTSTHKQERSYRTRTYAEEQHT